MENMSSEKICFIGYFGDYPANADNDASPAVFMPYLLRRRSSLSFITLDRPNDNNENNDNDNNENNDNENNDNDNDENIDNDNNEIIDNGKMTQ